MKSMESREDYLESILILKEQKGYVRSIDVASFLGYTKPSISRAISLLKKDGYVTMDEKDGALELTPRGLAAAQHVYERHLLLTEYLIKLGVSPETAAQDACRMEHVISDESFRQIKNHVKNV
ncbi:MAG: metal-dependent transcriptional regulator, partial [Oscillospiraceae bacterium]|nr:metal-dependent transcriptional regulator [Oscillospiraceae bacterium]